MITSVQDDFRMTSGWLHDSFRMTSGWLQDDFRMTSGWLQDDFRTTLGWLKKHSENKRVIRLCRTVGAKNTMSSWKPNSVSPAWGCGTLNSGSCFSLWSCWPCCSSPLPRWGKWRGWGRSCTRSSGSWPWKSCMFSGGAPSRHPELPRTRQVS